MAKPIRLGKAAGELNVGMSTLVEFLDKKGVKIDASPNAKLEPEHYDLLRTEFAADQTLKEQSKKTTAPQEKRETISLRDKNEETKPVEEKIETPKEEVKVEAPKPTVDEVKENPKPIEEKREGDVLSLIHI